jgi:hypothetical protein
MIGTIVIHLVIASKAKQSTFQQAATWIASSALLLAMTTRQTGDASSAQAPGER